MTAVKQADIAAASPYADVFAERGWQVPTYTAEVFAAKRARYALVVPVINEGVRIQRQLQRTFDVGVASQIDVIIVDGGSTDGSLERDFLRSVGVRAILTKRAPGKLSAQLRCGYAWALCEGYDGIVTIDGNDKDDPAEVPQFIKALDDHWDYVQASRFIKGGKGINTPLTRWLAIRFVHAPVLSLAAHCWLTDTTQGFRAYSARYMLSNRVQPFRDVFMVYELLAYLSVRAGQLGYKVKELPTTRSYPKNEKAPTKIVGWRPYYALISTLIKTLTGGYSPKARR